MARPNGHSWLASVACNVSAVCRSSESLGVSCHSAFYCAMAVAEFSALRTAPKGMPRWVHWDGPVGVVAVEAEVPEVAEDVKPKKGLNPTDSEALVSLENWESDAMVSDWLKRWALGTAKALSMACLMA